MFHVKQEEGGVPESGGGLPSLPPADLAFSLLFLPPSPRPPSPVGKGEIFGLFCRGLAPPAPPAAKPGRHWLFSAMSVLSAPIPPAPLSGGKGEIFCFLMQGAPPLASPGLSPGGTGYFLPCQCFLPPSPSPPSRREGGDFVLFCRGLAPPAPLLLNLRGAGLPGGSAPCIPVAKPARRWLFLPRQCFLPPSPRPPSPVGKGEIFGLFCRGLAPPRTPATEPGQHWLCLRSATT